MTAKTALPGDLSGPTENHAAYAAATKYLDLIRARVENAAGPRDANDWAAAATLADLALRLRALAQAALSVRRG